MNSTHSRRRASLAFQVIALCLSAIAFAQAQETNHAAVVREARASIVTLVLRYSRGGDIHLGRGFITDSASFIATSYKTIENVKDVSAIHVRVFGQQQTYGVLGIWASSRNLDIALLRVSQNVKTRMALGSSKLMVAEETVYVAADLASDADQLREAKFTGVRQINGKCFAQIAPQMETAIGGPVVNERGQVIGILVSPPEPDPEHSFAAPVSRIAWLMSSGFASRSAGGVPENSDADTDCIKAFSSPRSPIVFGVPGGVPGGVAGGVPGAGPPPPPPPAGSNVELPKIIRKSGGVFQGSATRRVEPQYPRDAIAARIRGSVVVEVTVDEQGRVISARALSGPVELRWAAVDAARRWEFHPTKLEGRPVKVIGTITFNFNL